ncbi:apolipoprotein B-100-like [Myripristis murdjan]|uniref:apolipoprotein B-100-like n=1 Tax=Myripristis murdjan TaxID=586833 RepID=UPI0011763218|nr:apolipoprotein B-100-like [Myripristis murdjan]
MGGIKLCLLLLLGTYTLAQQDVGSIEEQSPMCFLAKRFKNFKRYVYDYEAETFNGVTGATDYKSGPKVSCKVEIDVPQTCSFILRTTECSLSEIIDTDDQGNANYRQISQSSAFKAAMEKNTLKFMVAGQTDVTLFPEDDEPTDILNIKRGIISTLMVPVMEEEKNEEMATVHGVCETEFIVNAREDIATDVSVTRDLSRCDSFIAHREHTSPLALISGMQYPLSKLISSTQTCNYIFDKQKKHMTSGTCKEKHIFLPFSQENEYGISSVVKQRVTLVQSSKINDRVFDHNEANLKFLPMEAVEDKSPVQTKDAAIATMKKLIVQARATGGHQRATLFQQLVHELRGLKVDVLKSTAVEMMDMSEAVTFQALLQCGTPECSSATLHVLTTFDKAALEVDATVYALGLMPNPSRLLVKDMLAMAQYKQSKPIMFALSNVVRKLYQAEGQVTPEITAVSQFMVSILGEDCAGEKELTYMALRVVGNMGEAMEAADPTIKTILLKCMRQPITTLSVQLASIQAFRRMTITDEVRSNLQRVSQYAKGAVQKRLAAYLTLMRKPEASDFEMVKKLLKQEQNMQVKAFVTSHIHNIISSTDPETQKLASRMMEVLQTSDVDTHADYTTMSRNYKLGMAQDGMMADMQGNIIFDPSSHLPREVMLETTLKVFGYNMDMWEVGVEGKGFEPTIEALFGKNGFFPDTVSKALYWAEDKMPSKINEVLEKWTAPFKSNGQRVPDDLVREIVRNFNKLVKDLQSQDSTEAMAYLKIMGAELGYIKSSDLRFIANNALMYADILLMTIPKQVLQFAFMKMISGTDNELFAHYIFMDNKFTLPTASGLPLRFALSGTFAPGAKGGLRMTPNMEMSFMPSVGIEFLTQMGVFVPDIFKSNVEMHTNMYHESSLNAKITMGRDQVKLSIPAPQGTTKLFRLSNTLKIVDSNGFKTFEHTSGSSRCSRLFPGVKYCTNMLSTEAGVDTPSSPINGDTMFGIDLQPTGGVTEYTATFAYDALSEGEDEMVDSLKMTLRAEGSESTEATVTMKYNRNRNVFTSQIEIPDFDVEAGIQVGVANSRASGKSITLEISNKNIPQLSLIGRAKVHAMTDGMLQVQLVVPSLKTDAAVTATVQNAEGLTLEIKSDVKLPETSSVQAVIFKYGKDQAEVQLMSNMNADTKILMSSTEALRAWLSQFAEDVMDQQVVKTDMKVRHIITKAFEAGNIWIDKITDDVPYIQTLRDSVAEMEIPSMPDNLFMNLDSTFKYQFNKDHMTISVPLLLGGKSSEDLRIPPMFNTPHILVPQVGLEVTPRKIQVPTFTIPSEYDLTLPLMGMVEMSAKVKSNYYNWEGMVSAGNNTVESPSFSASFKIMADSPIELLSFTSDGAAVISDTPEETLRFTIDGSLKHKLMDATIAVLETVAISDKVLSTGSYKFQTFSPLGLQSALDVTSQCSLAPEMFTGDANMDGSLSVGSMSASTTYSQSFSVEPMNKEARIDSTFRVKSAMLNVVNKAKASYANEQLMIESNTNMNSDPVKHTTKFSMGYKDSQFTIQSDSVTKANEKMLRNQVELAASTAQASVRIENQAGDTENRAYSLFSGSMSPSGVELNADASINILASRASHKATLTLNTNGLTTSCTTTAQSSPVTFENVFHGGVETSGATMSLTTKGTITENKAELNVEGKIGSSEVYLNSMFKGNLFDANTRNRVNFRVNEDGLTLSNNLVGSLNDMKTDSTHSVSLTLKSLAIRSKTDNFLNNKNSYNHDITIDVERFITSVMVKNDLKIMDVNFVNDAHFKAEPFKMEMTGSIMGVLSEEELKHTYEVKFVDMILSAKCNTNGKLLGSQVAQTTDMEVAALSMKFNNVAKFNSPYLRFDSNVKTAAAPFSLDIDAILNSNGEVYLYGQQSGELYSKFLLKAEPMQFTQSFEYRASTAHELENGASIKTSMDNKFDSMMSLQEQSVTLKMASKLNNHALDQEVTAYNNAERMAVEMKGAVATNLFSKASENQDYSISGFVKYDKNSDSHFIQIPFIEHLPTVIEEMKTIIMRLMDHSIDMLKDFDTNYEISAKVQEKVSELKEVIDNFDFRMFVQDMKNFVSSMENHITNLMAKFPSEKIINALRSVMDSIMAWMKKHNIMNKINVIYAKIEEILSSYEVEKMIETIMDEAVKIMKQYQVREKIQSAFAALKSVDIQPLLNSIMAPVKEFVNQLYAFDFKQMIDDISIYFIRMVQKIKSFDYETFAMELKDKVTEMSKIPCFGKLYGEFRVISPEYSLRTTAELQNTTTTPNTPEFTMNLNSQATSPYAVLPYTLDASAHLSVPKMNRLSFSENIKAVHTFFTLDHQGMITLYGLSAQASAKTTAKATTKSYTGELVSNASFIMENGLSANVETNYKHDINMPSVELFSEASINQKAVFIVEAGTARLTINNVGKGKYAVLDYSDEATHNSDVDVVMDLHTVKVTFTGQTAGSRLKMNQNLNADICIFRHVIIDAKAETEAPFIRTSVAELKVQAKVEDLKVDFTASHNAELVGQIEGTLSNSVAALITPNELMFDAKNKGNTKVALPFKVTGKVDLQNDIALTLNSEVQQASWTGLARFNQHKYSHYFTMDNGEKQINIFAQIDGEANLDVLREPITIPEMTVPFLGLRTPKVERYSLWEDTGLSILLTTTQQTFDMDIKLKYMKNPEMITIDIDMEPIINAINKNARILHKNMLIGKDKAVAILTTSYDKAKSEYEKYSIDLPKTITVPAYKVPVINVDVSSFTIPLPDFSLIKTPALHVPSALSKMTFPKITLPKKSIMIPAMGDMSYEFSMKTAVITLKTEASVINQGDIIMNLHGSSSSEFQVLAGDIEGTTTINTANGMKMASVMSVKHTMVEGNHDSTIKISAEAMEASIANSMKVNSPVMLEINQEMFANPEEGLILSVASPSSGILSLQVQTKLPAQMKGRLYGRYPSQPTKDVDILAVKMAVVNSEKLSLQTTWNTEMPYEMMLGLKKNVPTVMEMVSRPIRMTYNEVTRLARNLEGSFEQAKQQGKVMFKRAADNLASLNLSEMTTSVADSTMLILREYQKNIQILLDAAIKFLRETKFQIPGYDQKLSGLEVYQKFSAFVADVSEEAIQKIPELFATQFEAILDHFRSIEFTVIGTNHIFSGREFIEDLMVVFKKLQGQVIVTVKKLGAIQLEDIIRKLSDLMHFTIDKSEELFNSLKSQDVEKISTWVNDVYTDAINSRIMADITKQIEETYRDVMEYVTVMRANLQQIFAEMSMEQLQADIQAWINSLVKKLNAFYNNAIELLKEKSATFKPFVRVSDRQMDVEIPFPFIPKSN